MPLKPPGGQLSHLFKRTGFFKEVRGAGHDGKVFLTSDAVKRLPVEPQHDLIALADD